MTNVPMYIFKMWAKINNTGTLGYNGWLNGSTDWSWTIGILMEIKLSDVKVRIIHEYLMRGISSEFLKFKST